MRGVVAIVTAAFVVVGCSIGALEGYSGGVPATDDGGDATPTTADADAPTDAPTSDADADAGAPFTCAQGSYLFCTTFDDGVIANGWDLTFEKQGGTLSLSNDARSPPYALRAQVPVTTSTNNQYARLYKAVAGTLPLRISFDVKIATPAWQSNDKAFAFLEINYPTSANSSYLFREVAQTTLSSEQNTSYTKVTDLPYEKWVRVALEVVPKTPTGALRLFYDGKQVYGNEAVPFQAPTTPSTDIFVGLVRFDPPGPPLDVLYDNVTIEQIP